MRAVLASLRRVPALARVVAGTGLALASTTNNGATSTESSSSWGWWTPAASAARRREAMFGFRSRRTARARELVTDADVVHISSLINVLIDMPFWSEAAEQQMFESAVSSVINEVAEVLPLPHVELLQRSQSKYMWDDDRGLSSSIALELEERLERHCRERCDFPFFDEQDTRRVIRAVVSLLVKAMRKGEGVCTLTSLEHSNKLVVRVFMRGILDVFFDEEQRQKLVLDFVEGYVKNVPFVPLSLVVAAADHLIERFSRRLHDALIRAFVEWSDASSKNDADLPLLPPALTSEPDIEKAQLERLLLPPYDGKPFAIQLRRVTVILLIEEGHLGKNWPLRYEAQFVAACVDAIFSALPGLDKLEHAVQPFNRRDGTAPCATLPTRKQEQPAPLQRISRRTLTNTEGQMRQTSEIFASFDDG